MNSIKNYLKFKKWKDANQILDNNWTLDETNMVLVVSYQKSSVDLKIETSVSGIFDGEPKFNIGAELDLEKRQELLTNFPIDKCIELKLYKTALPAGFENDRAVYKAGNFEFTLDMIWYR